jgi:diguanylate cyclase (GGDEF)-like protein
VARYGGDEFVVLIANSSKEEASTYAEHLRAEISAMEVRVPGQNASVKVNISVGVSTFPEDGVTTEELARAADIALYIAKKKGRNQVVLATHAWMKTGGAESVE